MELQKQRLAGEGTQFFPQEQALVRQRPLRSTDRQDLDDGADHADTVVIVATQQVSLHLQTVAAELLGEIQREVMYTRTRFEGPASALKVEKPNGRIYNGVRVRLERVGRSRAGARRWDEVRAPPGAQTPFPLRRSPPASFKRLLGSAR